jgi:hypothetical protein
MLLNKLIENTLRNTKLKRVRIKVDPSELPVFGYENVAHFEGYVLEECGTTVSVYIVNVPPNVSPIQQVGASQIEPVDEPTINPSFQNLKRNLLTALIRAGHGSESPVYNQIKASNNPEFIETFLKQANIDPETLLNTTFTEAATLSASNAQPAETQGDDLDEIFGRKKSRAKSILKSLENGGSISKGIGMVASAIDTASELALGKRNVVARLSSFLKTLNVQDLIDLKSLKLRSREYPHIPYKGNTVYFTGLPKLSYNQGPVKYQLKGSVASANYSAEGIKYVVSDINPGYPKLDKIMLDFSVLDNPRKTGKAIFIIDGQKRYSTAQITLTQDIWFVKILKYNVADRTPESSKGLIHAVRAKRLLKDLFEGSYQEAEKLPQFSDILMGFAQDLKGYDKSKLADVIAFFEELKKEPDFAGKSVAEKLNKLKVVIKIIKEEI